KNFTESHTHVLDLHHKIIFTVVIVALLIGIFKKVNIKPILGLLTLNVLFSAIYALWYWEGTRVLKDNIMLFNTFNISRIHFLQSRSEEHTSELQSRFDLVCRLLLEEKKTL